MVNWTAMRFKFKRSRRMQILSFIFVLAVSVTIAQLVGEALRPDPVRTGVAPGSDGSGPVATGTINVTISAPLWRVGDYWIWEDGYGLRIVDRVVEIRSAGTVPLYVVERSSSVSDGARPRVEEVVYDSRTLAVRSVTYVGSNLTVEWEQRTMGLLQTSKSVGTGSNATVSKDGDRVARFYRIANVTAIDTARVVVPAGTFTNTTFIRGTYRDYHLVDPTQSRYYVWRRWWSDEVGNDVAFSLPNASVDRKAPVLQLAGFRSQGRQFTPETVDSTPAWRTNFTWTWTSGPEGDDTRSVRVVSAEEGIVRTQEARRIRGDRFVDSATWRGSDLAPLNFTVRGALFEMDPSGVPFAFLRNGTFEYTKTVRIARPQSFAGNATVTAQPGAVVETPLGVFKAWRIDVLERETDAEGRVAVFRATRYYSPEVAQDVRYVDREGRVWDLASMDLGAVPFRVDTYPPP